MPGSRALENQIPNARYSKNDIYSCWVTKIKVQYARHFKNVLGTCKINLKCRKFKKSNPKEHCKLSYGII